MKRLLANEKARVLVLSFGAVCLLVLSSALPVYGDAAGESAQRLSDSDKYLSSDALEGRGIGTKGLDLAADYIRRQFEQAGLNVHSVNNGAYQSFAMTTGAKLGPKTKNTLVLTGPNGKKIELKYDTDFRTCSFGGSESFTGPVVFGGYGIEDKKDKYDDFAGIDLTGKVVIIMRRTPRQGNPHSPFGRGRGRVSRYAALRSKVSNAFGHGAAAVLFVNDPYSVRRSSAQAAKMVQQAEKRVVAAAEAFEAADQKDPKKLAEARQGLSRAVRVLKSLRGRAKHGTGDRLMPFGYGGTERKRTMPVVHITVKICDTLLEPVLKSTLAQLEAAIDKDLKPRTAVLKGWTAQGATAVTTTRAEVKNVIGVLEGEGPLADQTIVIGAHYDHLGYGGFGSRYRGKKKLIHNGADDNASGTAGLIELAHRLGARKKKLPRRIVFIAFTAEERGLIGSDHYVKSPLFPLEKTVAMFNMDMIGRLRNDKLIVYGVGTSPRWKPLLEQANRKEKLKLALLTEVGGRSDHASFYKKKMPVLHFFTGSHADYHKPSDDWNKINAAGMQRVVDLLEQVVLATAEAKARPEYVYVKPKRRPSRGGSRPYFGIRPAFGSDKPGCGVDGVSPDSPAAVAGVKAGDSIVGFGKLKVGDLEDFDAALRKFKPGDEVDFVVLRKGQRVKLKVVLGRPR